MEDLVNQKFNRLTVVKFHGYKYGYHTEWKCICDCGKEKIARSCHLKSGLVKSCGCLNNEQRSVNGKRNLLHGHARPNKITKEYIVWQNMKARCYNPKNKCFYLYGARDIKVCDRWLESFENFIADMGKAPSKELSIDRIDNNGDYEPSNCRWATKSEQVNNRRAARL